MTKETLSLTTDFLSNKDKENIEKDEDLRKLQEVSDAISKDPTKSSEAGVIELKGEQTEEVIKTGGTFAGKVKRFKNWDGTDAGFIEVDGVRFWEIHKNVREQQLVSLMLKGVVNVADIVVRDGVVYSKEMQVDNISESAQEKHRLSDIELLRLVFGDGVHETINQQLANGYDKHLVKNQNIFVNENNNKHALFDLDQVCVLDFAQMNNIAELAQDVADLNSENIDLIRLRGSIQSLVERFDGDDGLKFLISILQKVAKECGGEKHDEYEGLCLGNSKSRFDESVYNKETKEINLEFAQKFHKVIVRRLRAMELFLDMRMKHADAQLDIDEAEDLANDMMDAFEQKYAKN